ncbi:hypothetical protein B0F90DRAFT_1817733 [Multifurca ochricompacta]|uniref:RRM domain-containing protein n=1 Tax=Multifurca ochricompacta TaxID=376703 RepID=A0AAD4QN45_9AGAM|nr:hypothetical protein B0F90DRAFT_1817733 [Multifurca ochricompacta]
MSTSVEVDLPWKLLSPVRMLLRLSIIIFAYTSITNIEPLENLFACQDTQSQAILSRSTPKPRSAIQTKSSDTRRNLYVLGLPFDLSKAELSSIFSQFGTVTHCVILATVDNASRRRGFVVMSTHAEAKAAMDNFSQITIRQVIVSAPYFRSFILQWATQRFDHRCILGCSPAVSRHVLFARTLTLENQVDSTSSNPTLGATATFQSSCAPVDHSKSVKQLSGPQSCHASILVHNLPALLFAQDSDLEPLFCPFGDVREIQRQRLSSSATQSHTDTISVVVTYSSPAGAKEAKGALHGQSYGDSPLIVESLALFDDNESDWKPDQNHLSRSSLNPCASPFVSDSALAVSAPPTCFVSGNFPDYFSKPTSSGSATPFNRFSLPGSMLLGHRSLPASGLPSRSNSVASRPVPIARSSFYAGLVTSLPHSSPAIPSPDPFRQVLYSPKKFSSQILSHLFYTPASGMDSDHDHSRKRTQAVRPLPRRPFSSKLVNQEVIPETLPPIRFTGDISPSDGSRSAFLEGEALTESPIPSPSLPDEQRSFSPGPLPSTSRVGLIRSRPVKKSSLLSTISSSASDLVANGESPSPSKRWDDLRRHFLPARATVVQPSATTLPSPYPPPRPSTPKQFRIPKLGFKQVVEQAQEASVDQSKRFADNILKASRAVRSVEPKVSRREREGTLATMATSFNMNFMGSNTSLGIASTSTSNYPPQGRTKAVRRPPSLQSVALSSHPPTTTSASLYAVISYYASAAPTQQLRMNFLPHEDEVLSALLVPFMNLGNGGVDSERLQAMDVFEIIVRTWQAASEEAFLERCLWCCKVVRMTQNQRHVRMRVLDVLTSYLFFPGAPFRIESLVTLQTLFQVLFSLQGSLLVEGDSEAASYVHDLIRRVKKVGCEGLDDSLLMQQYGAQLLSEADTRAILDCVIIMALAACMENTTSGEYQNILQNMVAAKESWFGATRSSLSLTRIETLSIKQCLHALLSTLLPPDGARRSAEDYQLISQTLTEWLIPAAHALVQNDSFECKVMAARLALNVLIFSRKETREDIVSFIDKASCDHDQWKAALEAAIQIVVKEDTWETVIAILMALIEHLPNESRSLTATIILPAMNERLVLDPPPFPFPAFTELLEILSKKFPKLFYRPLFSCAAGTKASSILEHLRIIAILAHYLPSFWIRDPEMLLVAFMSDSSSTARDSQDNAGSAGPQWGHVRLGQLVILIELIAYVQAERQDKGSQAPSGSAFLAQARFFFALEYRLGAFLDGKERTLLIPTAQRTLLVILFFEIRLLLLSLKPAQWLASVVSWVASSEEGRQVAQDDVTTVLKHSLIFIILFNVGHPFLRRSTVLLSPSVSVDGASFVTSSPATPPPFLALSARERQLKTFSKGLISNSLRLLVAVSGLLSKEDHETLCTFLWQRCLTQAASEIQTWATFLIMQCAEKAPTTIVNLIKTDIRSSEAHRRLLVARRLSLISGWRFQMLSQDYIVDKSHRRPFKLARIPISFMSTDIGSSSFVLREDIEKGNASGGQALPPDLRKRLADIGWAQDESVMDQKHEWVMTPFSLLSVQQLEKLETGLPTTIGSRSPQLGALESPPSSAAEPPSSTLGIKRRSTFVSPLVSILPDLAALAYDADYTVANAARVAVMDFMRHDPALITRPALDALTAGETSLSSAFSVLRGYLHSHNTLPPAMAHHMFNHLAGYLKFSSRQTEAEDTLTGFAYAVPLLSKLVSQVSDMSLRELRRGKVDVFLIPSGSLWFPSSAPSGPMFPRSLSDIVSRSDRDTEHRLGRIVLVRVAQNLLFANMLRRNPQEVQAVRKSMSRLVLPTMDSADVLSMELRFLLPRKEKIRPFNSDAGADTSSLSLLLSRSHILLVTEIFRSMPRHLNDRGELAVLIDGLNRILLVHGDDIGIVAHVLIALMTASARFHRLFTSGGGYTLFIPTLFKVYAESEPDEGVRLAIEYSISRFYAVHQEAFVFQALNMLSHIVMFPEADGFWVAKQIFLLLSTLKDNSPVHAADAAGIHGSSRKWIQGEDVGIMMVPDQYEGGHLALDNFVRLFLTVIGHDPSIRRAQQFLRLLRLMAPHFYDASPASRNVLPGRHQRIEEEEPSHLFSQAAATSIDALEISKCPSDLEEMRFDYLSLVAEFSKSGGYFGTSGSGRIFDLAKMALKDSNIAGGERLKHVLAFLNELGSIFKAYAAAVDFSGVLEVVLHLAENPAFEKLASEGFALSTPLRPVLVKLLCQGTLLTGADIVSVIERRPMTFEFVAGILYPMALDLPSVAEIANDTRLMEAWRRAATRQMWTCLLQLAMQACQRQRTAEDSTDGSSHPQRSRSQEKKRNPVRNSPAATLSMALQTLKIIVLKAEDDLSISLPGIWVQMGSLLKNVLSAGSGRFGMSVHGATISSSPLESSMSLKLRTSEDSEFLAPSSPRVAPSLVQSSPRPSPPQLSIMDYLLWSILEYVCCHRSPLMLQMRLFLQEATATLDEELRAQHILPGISRRPSYASVFSKTRRKSGHWSRMPSPEASPFLAPLQPSHGDILLTPPKLERKPGYARSPTTPGGSEVADPKIVHLGPTQNFDVFRRSPSPGLGESGVKSRKWLMANSRTVRSAKLVRETYRRVRVVQQIMGYTELLPVPDGMEESEDDVKVWSRGRAIREVERETTSLMEEFCLEDEE